jgi:2,3,4,5-tetrahydropyridine-2-carboxylate N-succinyltransferase
MTDVRLQTQIEKAFEDRAKITSATEGDARDAVDEALDMLDRGKARVAEKLPGATGPNSWKVNQWLKKAVLLSFRLNDNALIDGGLHRPRCRADAELRQSRRLCR